MRIALAAAAMVVSVLGQASPTKEESLPFAGTWMAQHAGKSLARLELSVPGDQLVGRLSLADIHVDTVGDVDSVLSDLSESAPVMEIIVRGRTISFARKDGDDTDHFEMTLSADGLAAELRFLPSDAERRELADNGIPLPRPFRMSRVVP